MRALERHQLFLLLIFLSFLYHFRQANAKQITITNIQVNSTHESVDISFVKYENSNHFDFNLTLYKPLHENQLLLNLRLKRKPDGETSYRNLYAWKGIDLCSFVKRLNEKKMFKDNKKLTELNKQLQCPLKVGHYEFKNFEVGQVGFMQLSRTGQYRIIVEAVGEDGRKAFTMIINIRLA